MSFLQGIEPIHPMVVHFPIALVITACLFDLIGLFLEKRDFSQTAFYLLFVGTLGAIGAVLTGEYLAHEEAHSIQGIREVLHTHEEAGEWTLWFLIVYTFARGWFTYRKTWGRTQLRAFALASLIAVGLVVRTGFYGGKLVFEFGAGLKPAALERERHGGR